MHRVAFALASLLLSLAPRPSLAQCENRAIDGAWQRQSQALTKNRDALSLLACSGPTEEGPPLFYTVLVGLGEDGIFWPLGARTAGADVAQSTYREEVRIGLLNRFVFSCFAVPMGADEVSLTVDADHMGRTTDDTITIRTPVRGQLGTDEPGRNAEPCLVRLDCDDGRLPLGGTCVRGLDLPRIALRDLLFHFIATGQASVADRARLSDELTDLWRTDSPDLDSERLERIAAVLHWMAPRYGTTCDAREEAWRARLYGQRAARRLFDDPGCDERELDRLFRFACYLTALLIHAEFRYASE